jgi:hypothetical protein
MTPIHKRLAVMLKMALKCLNFFLFKAMQHNIIVIQVLDTLGVHISKAGNVTLYDLSRT